MKIAPCMTATDAGIIYVDHALSWEVKHLTAYPLANEILEAQRATQTGKQISTTASPSV